MADNADFSPEWKEIYAQNTDWQLILDSLPKGVDMQPPIYVRSRNTALPPEIGFRICAIRETFEESGVLLLKKNNLPLKSSVALYGSNLSLAISELRNWRKIVQQDASQFQRLCRCNIGIQYSVSHNPFYIIDEQYCSNLTLYKNITTYCYI